MSAPIDDPQTGPHGVLTQPAVQVAACGERATQTGSKVGSKWGANMRTERP
jgi:hypothetical protein